MKIEDRVLDKIREAVQTIEENRRHGTSGTKMMRNFVHDDVDITISFTDVKGK